MKTIIVFMFGAIFLMSSVCFGATKVDVTKIAVPRDSGRIVETYVSPNADAPVIAYLQSIHVNYEAQKALAAILESLIRDNGFDLVLVEGKPAGLNKDFKYLRERGSQEARDIAADDLLKKGTIKCTTYLDLTTDYKFVSEGVEDMASYQKEAEDLVVIYGIKDNMAKLISSLQNVASNLKLHIYTKEQRDLDDKIAAYDKDEIGLIEYVKFLETAAQANNIDVKAMPNLSLFIESANMEGQINFPAVETERQTVFAAAEKTLNGKAKEDLTAANLKFRTGDMTQAQFYTYLKDAAEVAKVDLTPHKNLSLYTNYIATYEKIDTTKLFKEIDQIADKLKAAMTKTPEQKKLGQIDKGLAIISDMINTKLVPDEFNYYMANKADFDAVSWLAFLKDNSAKFGLTNPVPDDVSILKTTMPLLEKFYAASFERDNAFVANIKSSLAKHNKDKAVFLCGGFHTPNMKKLLKENGFSYIIIAPRINIVNDYSNVYREGIKADLDYLKKNPQAITANTANLERVDEIATAQREVDGGVEGAQAKLDAAKARAETTIASLQTQLGDKNFEQLREAVLNATEANKESVKTQIRGLLSPHAALFEGPDGLRLSGILLTIPGLIGRDPDANNAPVMGKANTAYIDNNPQALVENFPDAAAAVAKKMGLSAATKGELIAAAATKQNFLRELQGNVECHEIGGHFLIHQMLALRATGRIDSEEKEEAVCEAIRRKLVGEAPAPQDAENLALLKRAADEVVKSQPDLQKVRDIIANLVDAPAGVATLDGLKASLTNKLFNGNEKLMPEVVFMNISKLIPPTPIEKRLAICGSYGLGVGVTAESVANANAFVSAVDTNNVAGVTSALTGVTPASPEFVAIFSALDQPQRNNFVAMTERVSGLEGFKGYAANEVEVVKRAAEATGITDQQRIQDMVDQRLAVNAALGRAITRETQKGVKVKGYRFLYDNTTAAKAGLNHLREAAKEAMAKTGLEGEVRVCRDAAAFATQRDAAIRDGYIPIALPSDIEGIDVSNLFALRVEAPISVNGIDLTVGLMRSAIALEGARNLPENQQLAIAAALTPVFRVFAMGRQEISVADVKNLIPGVVDDTVRRKLINRILLLPAATPLEIQQQRDLLVFASFA